MHIHTAFRFMLCIWLCKQFAGLMEFAFWSYLIDGNINDVFRRTLQRCSSEVECHKLQVCTAGKRPGIIYLDFDFGKLPCSDPMGS